MSKLLLLVNYGGPSLGREREYLKNLFSDEVLIPLPKHLRWLFANFIALLRYKETRQILEDMGGESPLKEQAERQVLKLSEILKDHRVDYAMLYSEPLLENKLKELQKEDFEEIKVLPLFPQYSAATWGSVEKKVSKSGLKNVKFLKPFYKCKGFLKGWEEAIKETVEGLKEPFLLFSAHSLPLYLVERYKDPYPGQVEETARFLAENLNLPYRVSYQSKLGPIRWLEPSTDWTIKELAKEGVEEIVVIPISFVAENSETLWEIDLNYRKLAKEVGIKTFRRVPIPYLSEYWLKCWASLTEQLS